MLADSRDQGTLSPNKVCALFGRALPRDFLDVDAAIMSGRYTREQLLELAAEADRGFDRLLSADALTTQKCSHPCAPQA
jgi:hypothetical protein